MKGSAAKQIGSVPYLNAAPLTWGMEAEIVLEPPSQLARRLHGGELSAALISITEVLFNPAYIVLDGFGIVSDGPVYSVCWHIGCRSKRFESSIWIRPVVPV